MGKQDLPTAVAEENAGLDALMDSLEKGVVPSPEVPAIAPEVPVAPVAPVETPVDDPPTPAPTDLEKELAKSQQRFNTLEGMMKADRKRSVEIIDGLERQLAARVVAEVEAPLDIGSLLTEDEVGQFGEEGIAVLEKLAGAIADKAISKKSLEVEQKLAEMQRRVEQAEAAGSGNTTFDFVEKINPGAKDINEKDQGWFDFLETVDPVSGSRYLDIGNAAAKVNDVQRLSQLIDIYRLSANLAKPVIPVKPSQTPVVPKNDGNNPVPLAEKRSYSQDEVREFYDNRIRGLKKGITANLTSEQIEALELDIDAAMEEGRVIL